MNPMHLKCILSTKVIQTNLTNNLDIGFLMDFFVAYKYISSLKIFMASFALKAFFTIV